jgi:transcriptional regulator with XRE-family HTH domain
MAYVHPLALRLKRAGIRPSDLARSIGYSAASVSRILHGRQPAMPLFRALVAEELDTPEAELFPDEVAADQARAAS